MASRATTLHKQMGTRLVTVEEMSALWAQIVHARGVREKQTAALITCFCAAGVHGARSGLTSRIRRRRARNVDDTTGSLRAVACIRFVQLWLVSGRAHLIWISE